jgi:hypothetical protein
MSLKVTKISAMKEIKTGTHFMCKNGRYPVLKQINLKKTKKGWVPEFVLEAWDSDRNSWIIWSADLGTFMDTCFGVINESCITPSGTIEFTDDHPRRPAPGA